LQRTSAWASRSLPRTDNERRTPIVRHWRLARNARPWFTQGHATLGSIQRSRALPFPDATREGCDQLAAQTPDRSSDDRKEHRPIHFHRLWNIESHRINFTMLCEEPASIALTLFGDYSGIFTLCDHQTLNGSNVPVINIIVKRVDAPQEMR